MIEAHATAPRLWRQLDLLRHFMVWLLVDEPKKIYQLWESTANSFEATIGVVTTARNITKPLFQDYTREGRIIGFFFRLARIAAGILIQIVIALFFVALAIAWYLLPAYIAYQIFSNLFSLFHV